MDLHLYPNLWRLNSHNLDILLGYSRGNRLLNNNGTYPKLFQIIMVILEENNNP